MGKISCFILVLLCSVEFVLAQCPSSVFTLPASACRNESIQLDYTPAPDINYEWDFCAGSILNTPTSVANSPIPGNSNSFDLDAVVEAEVKYVFIANREVNNIRRLNYGSSFSNVPGIENIATISSPQGIELWSEGTNKYALITTASGLVHRLSFGEAYANLPTISTITGLSGATDLRHLKIIKEGANTIAVIAGSATSEIILLNFGTSLLNTPTETRVSIPSGVFLTGLDLVRECDVTFGIISGFLSGIHVLEFGSSVLNTPTIKRLSDVAPAMDVLAPLGLSIVESGDNYHVLVSSNNASDGIVRLDFGNSIQNIPTGKTALGSFSTTNLAIGFKVFKTGSKYFGLATNYSDTKVLILDFPKDCDIVDAFSNQPFPKVSYSNAGTFRVMLTSVGVEGNRSSESYQITITAQHAPDIDFSYANACQNESTSFTAINTSGDLSHYSWNFGDGNTSTDVNPVTSYAAYGTYNARLLVEATSGCKNFIDKTIEINLAEADFDLPVAVTLCTNQEYVFTSLIDPYPVHTASWRWLVDGDEVSTDPELRQSFVAQNDYVIRLEIENGACSDFYEQTISILGVGPKVDFDVSGKCENVLTSFINQTIGDVLSYQWTFGPGSTSTEVSPEVMFDDPGVYVVELAAFGISGCDNVTSRNIQIFSDPQPNFNTDLPPFSCNGTPTQFNDLTPSLIDSNLESWFWNFNNNGATADSQSPTHTYALSGNYDVTLIVTSDQGCSGQLTKSIVISEAPNPSIVNTAACVNTGVEFTTSSTQPLVEWQWQIGNNFYFTENPSHVFEEPGDFTVSLVVTGQNGCMNSSSKDIPIPIPIGVDFTSTKKCVEADAEFSASTTAQGDLPSMYTWTLDGVEKQGQTITHSFTRADLYEVLLQVTSESGCVYSINKAQTVLEKPHADFSFSPKSGSPPLSVQFTNASANANTFLWSFNDAANSTSTAVSPNFVFNEIGNYPVDLLASNEEGCESTISKLLNVALPLLFVSLDEFEVIQDQNGLLQMRVTVNNEGNVDLQNLPLAVSLNNGTELYETVYEVLFGGESKTVVLATSISKTPGLQFLCLTLDLDNNSAGAIEEICLSLEGSTVFTAPHPNPAKDAVTLEWIAAEEEDITLSVVNTVGKEMFSTSFLSQQGLNSQILSTAQWQEGLYFVKVQSTGAEHTFRIIIVR